MERKAWMISGSTASKKTSGKYSAIVPLTNKTHLEQDPAIKWYSTPRRAAYIYWVD